MEKGFSHKTYLHILIIVMVGILVYSNTFHVPFIWDDAAAIEENPVIRNMENFFLNTSGYQFNPRRFIGYLTFALNYRIGGLDVTGYHVFNLAVHIINAVLVYGLILLTFRTPRLKGSSLSHFSGLLALLTALFFVVHPLQTQAVTYIVQRVTSLATMFYLLSLFLYAKWRLVQGPGNPSGGRRAVVLYVFSLISMVLAMKTKEIAFTLPIMVVLYEFCFFRRRKPVSLVPVLLTLFIIPMSMLTLDRPVGEIISDVSKRTYVQTDVSRWDYLMTQFTVMTTYVRLFFFPVNQNLDYDYPIYHSFFSPRVALSFVLIAFIVFIGLYAFYLSREGRRENRAEFRVVTFGISWFFIALSVESSIIPIADVIFEHRAYLPSVGFFMALATGIIMMVRAVRNRTSVKVMAAVIIAVVLVLGGTTYSRNTVWQNKVRFWEDVVKKSPLKARPHNALGVAYESEGRSDKAIEQFMIAIELKRDYPMAYYNLGVAYESEGRSDKAIEQFLIAVELKPDYQKAYYNLGVAYESEGRSDKAIDYYLVAVELKPDYEKAHYNLANAYMSQGLIDKAIEHYLIVVNLRPDYPEAHNNLGIAYGRLGMYKGAVESYKRAIASKPDYVPAYFNLGVAYIKLSDKVSALREYEKLKSLNPQLANRLFNMISQ